MKKSLFIILVFCFGLINVYADTYEDDTNAMMDMIDDEYVVNVAEGVNVDTGTGIYYLHDILPNIISEGYPSYTLYKDVSYSVSPIDSSHYQIIITNYRMCNIDENGYHEYCDEMIQKQKEVTFTVNRVPRSNLFDIIISELDLKSSLMAFSDRFDTITNTIPSMIFTTFVQSNIVANRYHVRYIKYNGFGGGVESNDESIFTALGSGEAMIIRDDTILGIIHICMISSENDFSKYYPTLELSGYENIYDYLDDAMEEFPAPILMPSYEIVPQDNGSNYLLEGDEYTINVRSGYDDVIWQVKFSGKLKNDPTLKGDMNGNGKIDLQDIIILLRMYLGIL